MPTLTYQERRGQLETYFDRMRATLLNLLPADLTGRKVLDAGCGTGSLAVEAARRGATVVAIDLSPTLIGLARDRLPTDLGPGSVEFRVGDLLDPSLGRFDHTVAMDSLIHYRTDDTVRVLAGLAARTDRSIAFTYAPRTLALAAMHIVGRLFPRRFRAPSIEPVATRTLVRRISADPNLSGWTPGRSERIVCGFYTSQALELRRP